MKYTADIWFDGIYTTIKLESCDGSKADSVLLVAQQIADKIGGECFSVNKQEEDDDKTNSTD
mgnify:CR=1 FL=1